MNTPAPVRARRALVWFRRDLRCDDHAALAEALRRCDRVWCAFVFDREILDALPERRDRRVEFIREALVELDAELRRHGGGLIVLHDRSRDAIPRLAAELDAGKVFANHDYEPAAQARDAAVAAALASDGRELATFKDQVVFERDEVMTAAGTPFSVFTPYRNAWLRRLAERDLAEHRVEFAGRLAPPPGAPASVSPATPRSREPVPTLAQIGFAPTNLRELRIPTGMSGAQRLFDEFRERIGRYHEARDFPAVRGPSYLSAHLRFGTISVRRLARFARQVVDGDPASAEGARVWLSELIWREFYFQVLHHHPHVVQGAFKPQYDRIRWETGARADELFAAWSAGRTGYPLVDAAMAQINHTGYMHNRLRMVAASFLVKDLGLDWRRGEAYFAAKLNDFDLAANNGGWQWAASSGCDAQPYFRIFNPVTQSRKFDPQGRFIRRYLPRLAGLADRAVHAPWLASAAELAAAGVRLGEDYPYPVVDHDAARRATLQRYEVVRL
jgi:deoxyribodipyrimidine photo-lyase